MNLTDKQISVLRAVAAGEWQQNQDHCLVYMGLLSLIREDEGPHKKWFSLTSVGLIVLDLLEELDAERKRLRLLKGLYEKADHLGELSATLDQGRHRMSRAEVEAANEDISAAFDEWAEAKAAYCKAGGEL